METVRRAAFGERQPDGRVLCTLCPHRCRIADGSRGACAVRFNDGGELYTLVYDRVLPPSLEPIEKKPLFHFLPGSLTYSISTVGCNLQCTFCQNWTVSQWPREHLPRRLVSPRGTAPLPLAALAYAIPGDLLTPKTIVKQAVASGASSIAYTFTEPTVFFELAYDTAVEAHARGLKNVFVTSGFISERPLRQIASVLDAVNVDLKFFRDESYRRISKASLQPILDAIRLYRALGVWVEVTTLVIPGINDSDEELGHIAAFLASVGREIPWHVSQFYPAYRMKGHRETPIETLDRACGIGRSAGLQYVYEGNAPDEGAENTVCPVCGAVVVERHGVTMRVNRIRDGKCPACGITVAGVGMDGVTASA